MSELQIALLAIGFVVIVAVYAFGWWQQRRYQRKFGATFKNTQTDVLHQDDHPKSADPVFQPTSTEWVADEHFLPDREVASIPIPDDSCAMLYERNDFIIELCLDEPSPASVLQGLWQRKFDFGKAVQICGLTLTTKHWERVIAESQTLYSEFRVTLQLVDRSGLISSAKLADFRDLTMGVAQHIKAQVRMPDVQEMLHYAHQLDAFCVVVDQMIGVNLMPAGDRLLSGATIFQAASRQGLSLEPDGAFHLLNARKHTLFSLINRDTKAFQSYTLERFTTPGLTLLLDVPRVENPTLQFDKMIQVAHEFAKELQVNLLDDRGAELTEAGLKRIRQKISEVEEKMHKQNVVPGSLQARRLFS